VIQRIARRADLDQAMKRVDEDLVKQKEKLRGAEQRVKLLEEAKANFKPIDLTSSEGSN
jgi:hypothetical protein